MFTDVDVNVTATEIVVALKAGQIKFNFIKVLVTLKKGKTLCYIVVNIIYVTLTTARRIDYYTISYATLQICWWYERSCYWNVNSKQKMYSATKVFCFSYKLWVWVMWYHFFIYSCTRGFVYSVSATVPVSQQYPTYNSIRMHWKKHVCAICCVHGWVSRQCVVYRYHNDYFVVKGVLTLLYWCCSNT